MAKYLVTSGSYFEPFTYEQLAAPVREAAAIHRASQDAYDQYNMEAEALRHYLDAEPDDSNARRMYESYMTKLQNLQNNLWSNGYNTQTRRDLAAARAGYASDITRLGKAIELRQKRSEDWGNYRREHPDAIMEDDPGLSSLDEYLMNDRYGSDFFVTSGNQLAQDVAADLKARGQELMSNPELMDMNLPEYYFLRTNNGFTNEQVNKAMDAVRSYWNGDDGKAMAALDPITKIAADTIKYHLDKTGASSKVTADEFGRALDFAAYGASQGVGEPKVEHLENKQWDYGMRDWLAAQKDDRDFNNWYKQQMITHPEWFDENGNRVIAAGTDYTDPSQYPTQYLYNEGPNVTKHLNALRKLTGDISPENLIRYTTAEGDKFADNWVEVYDWLHGDEASGWARKEYGFDLDVLPGRDRQQRVTITGTVGGEKVSYDVVTDKITKDDIEQAASRGVKLDKDDVAIRQVGRDGKERLDIDATKEYNAARKRHRGYMEEKVTQLNKDNDLSSITSLDLSDFKRKQGIDMRVPAQYVETVLALREGFGVEKLPTLVAPADTKKQKSYALELLSSASKNSLKPNSPFAIYRIDRATGAVDYKNPIKDIDQVLSIDNGGELAGNSGGLTSIEALPRDISTGRPEDEFGKLRVTTRQGTFLVDPRMFDSIVSDNVALQKLLEYDEMAEPFNDFSGKIFTESYNKSAERLNKARYHLGFNPPAEYKTMADVLRDPVWRARYYDALGNFTQTAFGRIEAE